MAYRDKEKAQAYQHEWYLRNKEAVIARSATFQAKHRDRIRLRYRTKYQEKYRKTKLMSLYKLSSEEFDRLDAIKACEICGKEKRLTFDHNHLTGVIRGRLCHNCNLGLGSLGDDYDNLIRAANYVKERSWQ